MIATRTSPPIVFTHTVRVYWEDTDAGGVVFYANYLKFFERARTEWLRSRGHAQQRLLQASGAMFIVTETCVRYRRPARLDDLIDITVAVQAAGRASLTVEQLALRAATMATTATASPERELLAASHVRIGCVDSGTFRPCRIPTDILETVS